MPTLSWPETAQVAWPSCPVLLGHHAPFVLYCRCAPSRLAFMAAASHRCPWRSRGLISVKWRRSPCDSLFREDDARLCSHRSAPSRRRTALPPSVLAALPLHLGTFLLNTFFCSVKHLIPFKELQNAMRQLLLSELVTGLELG